MTNDKFDYVQFANMMAHDVKGSVGNIVLFADLLREEMEDSTDDARTYLRQIESTGKRLLYLIETWAELHEMLMGVYEFKKTSCSASKIMEFAYGTLKFEMGQREVRFDLEIDGRATLPVDEHLAKRLAINVILGILSFLDHGSELRVFHSSNEQFQEVKFISPPLPGWDTYRDRLMAGITHPTEIEYTKGAIKPVIAGAYFVHTAMELIGGAIEIDEGDRNTIILRFPL